MRQIGELDARCSIALLTQHFEIMALSSHWTVLVLVMQLHNLLCTRTWISEKQIDWQLVLCYARTT